MPVLIKKLTGIFRLWRSNLRAAVSNYLVTREVTRVLRLTHAVELSTTPTNEWALVKSRQAQEIHAVASGQLRDIVDRRTWSYPYLPEALHRLNQPILKNTPYNLRRFSETPIPRRAINLIKNSILSLDWKVAPQEKSGKVTDPDMEQRIRILTKVLEHPNNTDSFRDLFEPVVEDVICGGYGCIEPRLTPDYRRPVKMWPVDGSTIRIFMDWTESTPDRPKYAQMTGLKGERGIVTFLADELIYIRDNVRTATPFGLGKLEVAFNTVNSFLGVQDMAGKAGSDQVHKTWLWWEQTVNPGHLQTVRRHIYHELEGQQKISLQAGLKKPEVIEVQAVTPEDLLLDWQEFLIRIIANAFDISAMALGLERDVNRNTGEVLADADFRGAVVPMASRLQDAITRYLIHGILGWTDLKFEFLGLDDPDSMTKKQLQRMDYQMNAITPDEIREDQGKPPLPGGWGRLVMGQFMIIMARAQALMGVKGGASGTGGSGLGSASGGMGGGMGSGMSSGMGGGAGMGMKFSAMDVASMAPEEIEMYQQLGLLPPTQELGQQMEQEQPGILEQLTDELRQFFDTEESMEDQMQVQPAPVTTQNEAAQIKKWQDAEHVEDELETVINRRGIFGPEVDQSIAKSPERGKYPRSGGKFVDPRKDLKPGKQGKRQGPKGHYRPGKGNPYQ